MTWSGLPGREFGTILRSFRVRIGLSQDELAGRARLSVRAVRELEAGRVSRPQSRTVHRLVTALELPPADAQALLAAAGAGRSGGTAGSAGLHVGILGPLVVRSGTATVTVSRPKLRALLALLALNAGRPAPIDEILSVLWGDRAPRSASNQVQVYVTQLRQLIEPARGTRRPPDRVVRSSDGYLLQLRDDESDAAAFRQTTVLAAQALRDGDTDTAARLYADALGSWRGAVLADVPVLRHHPEAVALARRRIDAALAFADLAGDRDEHAQATQWLQELAVDEPLHEALAARLMLVLAANGEQAAALALYDRTRQRLDEELGVDPGEELQDARLRVLRQQTGAGGTGTSVVGSAATVVPAAPISATPMSVTPGPVTPVPAQLPLGLRGFTGRRAALDELDRMIDSGQDTPTAVVISAVSGTAGIGKTSLAVHWAHRVAQRFPDGQLYVDLRGFDHGERITTPAEAIRGFLDALGVTPDRVPARVDAQAALYRSILAGKRALVVLDNARDADQVRPLLPGTATAFTLVTSRNRLGGLVATHAACPLTLDVLSATEARRLLAARLSDERVAAEPQVVDAIITACAHLPLALAITAARAQQTTEPLATVARQLEARLLDALDAGDAASRIRAVFSWSYAALTRPAARLFRLLGLHPGPDIDAATASNLAAVTVPEVYRLLTELVEANLLTERVSGRYTFHDLLRAYAVDVSAIEDSEGDRRAAAHRLLDYYVHTAYAADRHLSPLREPMLLPMAEPAEGVCPGQPQDQPDAINWCTAEQSAMLALQRHAVRIGFDTHAWQLAWCLDTYVSRRGSRQHLIEIWEIASQAAQRLGQPTAQAQAHRGLAHAYLMLGEYDEAGNQLQRSLDRAAEGGDLIAVAFTHRLMAQVHWRRGDLRQALHHAELMLALLRETGHPQRLAIALNAVGWYHALLGNHTAAVAHCEEALQLYQRSGNQFGQAKTLDSLGYAYHHLGEHARAVDSYGKAVVLFQEIGDRYNEADTLARLGDAHRFAGDLVRAGANWQCALRILQELDHPDAHEVRAKLDQLPSAASAGIRA